MFRIRLLIAIIFVTMALSSNAQVNRGLSASKGLHKLKFLYTDDFEFYKIRWGFSVGMNAMNLIAKGSKSPVNNINGVPTQYYPITREVIPGFSVAGIMKMNFNYYFELRVTLGYTLGNRTVTYYPRDVVTSVTKDTLKHDYAPSFVESSILIKWKAFRKGNFRPYVIAGFSPKFNISSLKKEGPTRPLHLKPFNLHAEMGMGFDIYTPSVKLGIEVRYSMGLLNIHGGTSGPEFQQISDATKSVRMNQVVIAINFEQ